MTSVAICQSNYIPWKGYFDLIRSADHFVLYDCMQYTRRDWRNRNLVPTESGTKWLMIPVKVKGRYHQKISETMISDPLWAMKHWSSLCATYKKAPFFDDVAAVIEPLYLDASQLDFLSEINFLFIKTITNLLNIPTTLHWSSSFDFKEGRTERLLRICQTLGATTYVSGPSAKAYINEEIFKKKNVNVNWLEYNSYPEYRQLHEPFNHHVTILDLFFNVGIENACDFLMSKARSDT